MYIPADRTLRKEYGDGFAKGYRADAQLGTVHELLTRKR
jgi:hypothetical protein